MSSTWSTSHPPDLYLSPTFDLPVTWSTWSNLICQCTCDLPWIYQWSTCDLPVIRLWFVCDPPCDPCLLSTCEPTEIYLWSTTCFDMSSRWSTSDSFSKHRLLKEGSVNLSTNFPEKRRLSWDPFRKIHNCGLVSISWLNTCDVLFISMKHRKKNGMCATAVDRAFFKWYSTW